MKVIAALFGAIIVLNPYVPGASGHIRFLDIIAALSVPLIIAHVCRARNVDGAFIGSACILVLEIPWIITDLQSHQDFTLMVSMRWVALTSVGLLLALLYKNASTRVSLAYGILAGSAANSAILWLQSLGLTSTLIRLGLAYPSLKNFWSGGGQRYYGLHGHPNSAAAVISLAIPAAIALCVHYGKTFFMSFIATPICIAGATLTLTRSAFLIGGISSLAWFAKLGRDRLQTLVPLLMLTSGILYWLALPTLSDRWALDNSSESNAAIRIETTIQSLSAAIRSPLGLGTEFHEHLELGVPFATHNAFTQLALLGGLPLALVALGSILHSARRIWGRPLLHNWIAAHTLGLCFFEEHFYNPTFIVIAIWLILIAFQSAIPETKNRRKKTTGSRAFPGAAGEAVQEHTIPNDPQWQTTH